MAATKTLLDGVNDVLIRVGQIDSDKKLTSLSAPAQQRFIDTCINNWNEATQQLYTLVKQPFPAETKEFQFFLQGPNATFPNGQREYDLPDDLIQIRWPIEDRVNGLRIWEYTGGFEAMRLAQNIPSQWRGLPYRACISPITKKLRMERFPTAQETGRIYEGTYDSTLRMGIAQDTYPFDDTIYDAMLAPVAALWQMEHNAQTTILGAPNYARAARLLGMNTHLDVY